MNWQCGSGLGGHARPGIGANGRNRGAGATSAFWVTSLAMASPGPLHSPQLIVSARDLLLRMPHHHVAAAQPARVDAAATHLTGRSKRPGEPLRPRDVSFGNHEPLPLSPIVDQSAAPRGRQIAASWLICLLIAGLALWETGGLHQREMPAATAADRSAISMADTGCPLGPPRCALGGAGCPEPC